MRAIRFVSTTAAILLLSACAVSAQGMKTDETPGTPAAQQTAPPDKMAPAGNADQIKAPEKASQVAPTAPQSDSKQQAMDKSAPASVATKRSSDADGDAAMKSKRVERHMGARYAASRHGPLYNSYRGDRWYNGCHRHRHGWMPWLGC